MPEFAGLKISQDAKVRARPWDVKRIRVEKNCDMFLVAKPGVVGWGGNGGFHSMQLAVQFGAKRLLLVGFDMRVDHGLHWHGRHGGGLNNPNPQNVVRWRRVIDAAAPALQALGVTVINCSPISALEAYPKMSLSEALDAEEAVAA